MNLVLLRSTCDNARVCPNINITDRGTFVVQGPPAAKHSAAALTGLHPDLGDTVVEIPLSLVPELDVTAPRTGLRSTGSGTVLIQGVRVTDQEALTELNLPVHETAVEIPTALLHEVREAVSAG